MGVGNLSYDLQRKEVRNFFERYGTLLDVYTPYEMESSEKAHRLIEELYVELGPCGRKLFVKEAKPR